MSARNVPQLTFESIQIRARYQAVPRKGTMPQEQSQTVNVRACVSSLHPKIGYAEIHNASVIRRFPFFSNLSLEECQEIVSLARQEEYARKQTIYLEGDPVRQILLLISGCVKVSQVGQNGAEVILRLNAPGDMLGKIGCSQTRHRSMAQALNPSIMLAWDVAVFESLSQRIPALRRNTVDTLSERLEKLEERFREMSTERVAARLSREIIRLLVQVGKPVDGGTEINLSREDLAQLIGTTLFTVSRLLSDWDERGIVSARREAVSVLNLQALQQLAESIE